MNRSAIGRRLVAGLMVVTLLALSACDLPLIRHSEASARVGPPEGPKFTPESMRPPDSAIVYIYRHHALGESYIVSANDVPLAPLPNEGYFEFRASPGQVEFSAKMGLVPRTSVTLDAKAGETYYVKATIRGGILIEHPNLEVVSNDMGAREILECRLVLQSASETAQLRRTLLDNVTVPKDEGAVTTYRVHWFSGINPLGKGPEYLEAHEYAVDGALKLTDRSVTLLVGSDLAAQTGRGLSISYSDIASIEVVQSGLIGNAGLFGSNRAIVIKRRDYRVDSFQVYGGRPIMGWDRRRTEAAAELLRSKVEAQRNSTPQ